MILLTLTQFYEPFKPSTFVCKPAAALIITKGGEIEVVSQNCSLPIATFPKFAGSGRTSNLMDEELLILGNDYLGTSARYFSIQKPRDGLLAIKYTVQDIPLTHSPHEHSSLVSGNTLTVVGGKFKSRGKLSKFTWTEHFLRWRNGTHYTPYLAAACSVKLDRDVHIIIGGERTIDGQQISVSEVVKINTTEEIVDELKPITNRRVSHDCQLVNRNIILVSGGLVEKRGASSDVLPDELYNITSQEVIEVLSANKSLGRFQHNLAKIGDKIWAVGGKDSKNVTLSQIAEFDSFTNSWESLTQKLHSTNTSELVTTSFPAASLDCVPQCQCGVPNMEDRIFGGSVAQVSIVDMDVLSTTPSLPG